MVLLILQLVELLEEKLGLETETLVVSSLVLLNLLIVWLLVAT